MHSNNDNKYCHICDFPLKYDPYDQWICLSPDKDHSFVVEYTDGEIDLIDISDAKENYAFCFYKSKRTEFYIREVRSTVYKIFTAKEILIELDKLAKYDNF